MSKYRVTRFSSGAYLALLGRRNVASRYRKQNTASDTARATSPSLTERSRPSIECWRRRRVNTTRFSALPITPNRQTAGPRTSLMTHDRRYGDDDDDELDMFGYRAFHGTDSAWRTSDVMLAMYTSQGTWSDAILACISVVMPMMRLATVRPTAVTAVRCVRDTRKRESCRTTDGLATCLLRQTGAHRQVTSVSYWATSWFYVRTAGWIGSRAHGSAMRRCKHFITVDWQLWYDVPIAPQCIKHGSGKRLTLTRRVLTWRAAVRDHSSRFANRRSSRLATYYRHSIYIMRS